LPDHFARDQQVAGRLAGEFAAQRAAQCGRCHERQVEEIRLDRIEVFPGLGQQVERALETLAGVRQIAFQGGLGRRDRLAPELVLVETAHVPQLASDQLDLKLAETQCVEIGDQIGIEVVGAVVKFLEDRRDGAIAVRKIPDHAGPGVDGRLDPTVGQKRFAGVRQQDKRLGQLLALGRLFRADPTRSGSGGSHNGGMEGRGPSREELLGVVGAPIQREILQTPAGKEDYDVFESHGRRNRVLQSVCEHISPGPLIRWVAGA
jgi:hypothetical protein